jgi:hypothetical protein
MTTGIIEKCTLLSAAHACGRGLGQARKIETAMEKAALQASLNTLDIWLIIFGLLVAIGAVGGSVTGFLHFRRSGQLQVILEAENLAQRNEIAQANARAAEANRKAEQERLARVKLEAKLAPRTIQQPQQQAIAGKLAEFKGQKAGLGVWPSSPETELLARELAAALTMAGWEIEYGPPPNQPLWPGGVLVCSTPHPQSVRAATKLVEALKDEGIFAQTAPLLDLPTIGPAQTDAVSDPVASRVFVIVAAKPLD